MRMLYIKYLIKKWKYSKEGTIIKSKYISFKANIGKECLIEENVSLYGDCQIGDYSYVNINSHIDSKVIIGKYCSISSNVHIGIADHYINTVTTHPIIYNQFWKKKFGIQSSVNDLVLPKDYEKETIIGNDVLIGTGAIIKRGVKIGDGAVIAAGAIVTKNVEPYQVVGGVPAKILYYRFKEEQVEELEKCCWWNWDKEKISKAYKYMNNIEAFIKYCNKEK